MRRTMSALVAAAVTASILVVSGCSSNSAVQQYVDAWTQSKAIAGATEKSLVSTMDEAYGFGAKVADGLPVAGERFGYKFGCGAAVCPFAEHVPLVGTLWRRMVQPAGSIVDTSKYVRGFVEGELAFKLPADITAPVTAQQLREMNVQVAPAVELPNFPFGKGPLSDTPILDVIADNGIARGVVVGDFVPASAVDVDAVKLVGTRDGTRVLSGGSADVTRGSHWEALALSISLLLEHGREVKSGDSIITGTMGEPTPFEDGMYELTYGPLGSISFRGAAG